MAALRSTFDGSLPEERAAAVTGPSAVAVHNDFASGQTGVALRPADDEASRRVDKKLRFLREQMFRQNFLDDVLNAKFLDGLVLRVVRVLRGNDNVRDGHRLVVDVLHGHLRLRVGPQPGESCRSCGCA